MRKIFFLALYTLCLSASAQQTVLLNGQWLMGESRIYTHAENRRCPSLAVFINPNIPIKQTDVSAGYKNANTGMAQSMQRMVNAGKNLTRLPVIGIQFGEGKGNLLISQLLTAGRMANIDKTGKPFERRYDETAVQMVLNMLEQVIKKDE